MTMVWTFLNSPLGVTLVVGVISVVLSVVFKKQPAWEKVYDQYKGTFFDAVKFAEKAIKDDTKSGAARKVDLALKYISDLEPQLAKKKDLDLKKALDKAHGEGEKKVRDIAQAIGKLPGDDANGS